MYVCFYQFNYIETKSAKLHSVSPISFLSVSLISKLDPEQIIEAIISVIHLTLYQISSFWVLFLCAAALEAQRGII